MSTIVVGTDTSAAADLAVENAARLARDRHGELLVLYVRPEGDLRGVMDPDRAADPGGYLARVPHRFPGLRARTRIVTGGVADGICEVALLEDAEVIVLGNRGTQGRWWRVRDSVPNLVLRHAPCSVYIVDTRKAQR